MFPVLIPAIMWLGHKVFGALEPTAASLIASEIEKLSGSSNLVNDVLNVFKSHVANVSQAQEEQFKLELTSLTGQIDLDAIDEQSESFFKYGPRPFLFWGLSIITLLHCAIAETINILHMFHIEISQIAPLDIVTAGLITGLLGLHIVSRTAEKIKGVN